MKRNWLSVCGIAASILVMTLLAGSHQAGAQVASTPSPWDDPALRAKIHPALLKQLAQGVSHQAPVIVEIKPQAAAAVAAQPVEDRTAARAAMVESLRSTAEASQRDVRAFLAIQESAGLASQVQSLWIVNAVGLHAAPQTIAQLAARPDVSLIREDRWRPWLDSSVKSLVSNIQPPTSNLQSLTSEPEWGIRKIRADQVWDALGITGEGVVVANMDTGVDFLHPALSGNYRGCVKGLCQHGSSWYDATPNGAAYPTDGNGHGTHTMGTLAGQGGIGVAPGAQWIAVRVLDSGGYGYDTWIHAGFQWLLAPGGDPAKSPDLVNNSWGNSASGDTTFQNDVRALRAAGILPIFSNGNSGPGAGTVGSPAALPEVFAVGATDDTDLVAYFSSRGPSPWGEVRPHVVAPGVHVRSAWPGGGYQWLNGTSMAAPHVAGVAALVLSANPSMTITSTAYVLTSTVVPLSTTVPNNVSGWGRVDAYAAVRAAASFGGLSGNVRDAVTYEAIAHVSVTASGVHTMAAQTDANGNYAMGLAAGIYQASANAFGYQPGLIANVSVKQGGVSVRNFDLTPLPTGQVHGTVKDAATGFPLAATVAVLGTPITQTALGTYSLILPAGAYTLSAAQMGYRVATATVALAAGEVITQDLMLVRGPKVLLVDSGAWYSESQAGYFQRALDDLGYTYKTWPIRDTLTDVPRGSDLLPYDVVIWSSPQDSPGFLGAGQAITTFLTTTKSLLLSGQDVAYWDGGGSMFMYSPYLNTHLKTLFVADDSGVRALSGTVGGIMAGLAITIAGPGGADNQILPDEIAVSDARYASQIFAYQGDGSGGQMVGQCLAHRGAVLSFGFEGITEAVARQAVMRRVMDYFASPRRAAGLELYPTSDLIVARPGDTVTHAIVLRNVGEVTGDGVALTAQGGAWHYAISPTIAFVRSCESLTVTLSVTVPSGLNWNASDVVTLEARSLLSPSIAATAVLTTKTPAPVLLVDDHRWYDKSDVFRKALSQAGLAYDTWNVNPQGWSQIPSAARLGWYPIVVWFTGYNWYDPVKPAGAANLAAYLQQGGRLFLSSVFYPYDLESNALTRQLGVGAFTSGVTTSMAYGAANSPIGRGLGALALENPYPQAGFYVMDGAVLPERDADTALRGNADRALAVQRAAAGSRSVYMVTPFEALSGADAARVIGRIAGWLGWLGDSTAQASREVALPGDQVGYTLTVRHNGSMPMHSTLTATLPVGAAYVPGSLSPGASIDGAGRTITWTGTLTPAAALTVTYQTLLEQKVLPGTWLTTTVMFNDDTHSLPFEQSSVVRVAAPSLSHDYRLPELVRPGAQVTHTLIVSNTGLAPANSARITWLLPWRTWPLAATVAGSGSITRTGDVIYWQGPLAVGELVTLTFSMIAPRSAATRFQLSEALMWDGSGGMWERSAWLAVTPYQSYLPLVLRTAD